MRLFLILVGNIVLTLTCIGQNHDNTKINQSNIHEVVVQEVIQTSNYIYLRVKENNIEKWLATPKMQVKIGGTYYYKGGMEMKNFQSKELDRTFESVFFLEKISDNPETVKKTEAPVSPHTSKSKTAAVKKEIKITPIEGGSTIAELFANKESFSGKIVKIKGQVTKFSASIMGKNWIHLQDGTDYNGKFDLVATTGIMFKVGDIITIEGKITLDKDFGYGYSYEVIMEDAALK